MYCRVMCVCVEVGIDDAWTCPARSSSRPPFFPRWEPSQAGRRAQLPSVMQPPSCLAFAPAPDPWSYYDTCSVLRTSPPPPPSTYTYIMLRFPTHLPPHAHPCMRSDRRRLNHAVLSLLRIAPPHTPHATRTHALPAPPTTPLHIALRRSSMASTGARRRNAATPR